ncbi:MAG: complex I NDUFA9 subunit family protein [Methylotenera sp.]|nr:complex I NDUFA9 subunit family protein [Methylotenera sp.]
MQEKKVCVLGGSGFMGSAIVAKLAKAGYAVTVLTRHRDKAKHLLLLPKVSVVECQVFNKQALMSSLAGADAVINLIGILHQSTRLSFNTAHHQLPEQLANLCADLGIKRLLHMSSLRASGHAPSQYLRSKAAGEKALTEFNHKLDITVFQPSIIFGRGDRLTNLFATLVKCLPVVLLAKPNAKFQPIWVEDVASCFVESLENTATFGKTYALVGPKVYTFRALVQQVMAILGVQRPIIGLNDTFSMAQAFLMELLPIKLMSRDNIRSMQVSSVSDYDFSKDFCIQRASLEAVMPDYLVDANARGAYDAFRRHAAR